MVLALAGDSTMTRGLPIGGTAKGAADGLSIAPAGPGPPPPGPPGPPGPPEPPGPKPDFPTQNV